MAGTISERLALIIDAHTDGAVSAIHRLSLEEQAAAERATILEAKIADLNTKMAASASGGTALQQRQLAKLNSEYTALTSTLAAVPASVSKVESALGKVGLGGLVPSSTLGAIGKVGPGLLAGAAAFGGFEFIKSGVEDFINLADAIRKFQQASGASAEDASKLVGISNALGLSTDSLSLGMFRLAKNISLTPEHLTQYGVAIAKTANGNTDLVGTLENLTEAYQKTSDPAQRAALVYEAFGRAGTSLLPILNANRHQIEELVKAEQTRGHIFDQADINNAYQYQIATRELKDSFQSLAISAGKTLVPALTDVAHILTTLSDATHSSVFSKVWGVAKYLPIDPLSPYYDIKGALHLFGFGGGSGGPSAEEQAKQQIADEQAQQLQAQLAQAALSTLAASTDKLAGPENIRTAKASLADARSSLQDAVAARQAAVRDLNAARLGDPGATAAQIEAANARITAAQASLKTAQYLGGDQRIASAQASLASAQSSLNQLRKQGGVDTNRLADAEDRLRKANKAVADQQAAARKAQRAVNQATGLNADQVLGRIRAQAQDQATLAAANVKLAARGASSTVIADLDKLNQQIPGTLVKVAHTLSKGTIQALNAQEDKLGAAKSAFADAAADPTAYLLAGQKAGTAFVKGFGAILRDGLPGIGDGTPRPLLGNALGYRRRGSGGRNSSGLDLLTNGLPPQGDVHVHGGLHVHGSTSKQVARDVSRRARHARLGSGGGLDPLGDGPGGA